MQAFTGYGSRFLFSKKFSKYFHIFLNIKWRLQIYLKSITKYCKIVFLKWTKVPNPVFASLCSRKKHGSVSEGKGPMPPLNKFSDFFLFKKIAIFVTFL